MDYSIWILNNSTYCSFFVIQILFFQFFSLCWFGIFFLLYEFLLELEFLFYSGRKNRVVFVGCFFCGRFFGGWFLGLKKFFFHFWLDNLFARWWSFTNVWLPARLPCTHLFIREEMINWAMLPSTTPPKNTQKVYLTFSLFAFWSIAVICLIHFHVLGTNLANFWLSKVNKFRSPFFCLSLFVQFLHLLSFMALTRFFS